MSRSERGQYARICCCRLSCDYFEERPSKKTKHSAANVKQTNAAFKACDEKLPCLRNRHTRLLFKVLSTYLQKIDRRTWLE